MNQPEPATPAETMADLTARLAAAERALTARDKTIQALITREKDRTAKHASTFGTMEENATLHQVVLRKTLELEAQNRQLEQTSITLRQNEVRMRLQTAALESTALGVVITDPEGTIQWTNPAFTQLTGYSAAEAIGQNPRIFKSGQHPDSFYKDLWETIATGHVWKGEIINRRKDGSLYPEEMTITPVRDGSGATTHFVALKNDIAERKHTERKVEAAYEKEVVLRREIQHRVKNSIQIISSLLHLQSLEITDPKMIEVLRECQNRARSIALVYSMLSQHMEITNIDFGAYVQELISALATAYSIRREKVTFSIRKEPISLDLDTAVPCGLIITELISNALKYGLPKGRNGEIGIGLHPTGTDDLVLTVHDNGVGLPDGFNLDNQRSLGLRLVRDLTRQIGGKIEFLRDEGTTVSIRFPFHPNPH